MSESDPAYPACIAHALAHSDASAEGTVVSCAYGRDDQACTMSRGRKKQAAVYQAEGVIIGQTLGADIKSVISGKKRCEPDETNDENSEAAHFSESGKRPNTQGGVGTEYALASSRVGNGHFSEALVDPSMHSALIST